MPHLLDDEAEPIIERIGIRPIHDGTRPLRARHAYARTYIIHLPVDGHTDLHGAFLPVASASAMVEYQSDCMFPHLIAFLVKCLPT